MSTEEAVRDSQLLLERMTEDPGAVLSALGPREQDKIMGELGVLAERASKVQAEADLLYVAEAVHRLVEERPALIALLLPSNTGAKAFENRPKTRKITVKLDQAAYRKSLHAQRRAAQIRNRVLECRENLERALREAAERQSDDAG